MSFPRCALCLFLLTLMVAAQEKSQTDAQLDDLAGPIKSVSSTVVRTSVQWQQPGGPGLLIPISCEDCDYDSDGFRFGGERTNSRPNPERRNREAVRKSLS